MSPDAHGPISLHCEKHCCKFACQGRRMPLHKRSVVLSWKSNLLLASWTTEQHSQGWTRLCLLCCIHIYWIKSMGATGTQTVGPVGKPETEQLQGEVKENASALAPWAAEMRKLFGRSREFFSQSRTSLASCASEQLNGAPSPTLSISLWTYMVYSCSQTLC